MDSSDSETDLNQFLAVAAAESATVSAIREDGKSIKHTMGSQIDRTGNRDFRTYEKCWSLDRDLLCRESPGTPLFTEAEFEVPLMVLTSGPGKIYIYSEII